MLRDFILAALLLSLGVPSLWAQRQPMRPSPGRNERQDDDKPQPPPLPSDPRLLTLHREFVKKAEQLGKEYEAKQDWDKAKDVYQEILKLVPAYPNAKRKLEELNARERSANRTTFEVLADKEWQDTGIEVSAGKPLLIRAAGSWTFTLKVPVTAKGMEIPKELRDYNLGCLLGTIVDPRNPQEIESFVVGEQKSLVAPQSGRLYLRMYDTNVQDNEGSLKVEISGTFEDRRK